MEEKCHAQCTAQVTGHETDARRGNGSPETGGSDGIRESKGGDKRYNNILSHKMRSVPVS